MNIKRSFGASVLFDRRPISATIALSLAALAAFATLFGGITSLLSVTGSYFDFVPISSDEVISWRIALVTTIWSLLEIVVIFLALQPRPLARFAVISMVGVKLLAFLRIEPSNLPIWQYAALLMLSIAPIILLLSRESNSYYTLK